MVLGQRQHLKTIRRREVFGLDPYAHAVNAVRLDVDRLRDAPMAMLVRLEIFHPQRCFAAMFHLGIDEADFPRHVLEIEIRHRIPFFDLFKIAVGDLDSRVGDKRGFILGHAEGGVLHAEPLRQVFIEAQGGVAIADREAGGDEFDAELLAGFLQVLEPAEVIRILAAQ